jgi:non-specific serine/threonine protein kinase
MKRMRWSSSPQQPRGIPLAVSRFVGRERELDEVQALVLANRLVTLTGTGGAGKTRLAYEAGRRLAREFADGVTAVALDALEDADLLPYATAEALDVPDRADRPMLEGLTDALNGRELLLILDNCEHLLEPCARLVEALLTRCCLDLRILVTSREPLGVAGERLYPVPPLGVPPPAGAGTPPNLREIESFDAVRLFVERTRAAAPSFALTDGNAAAVVEICRRLDGLPLGIELAAIRAKVLTTGQIAARLAESLDLLSGGPRTAPRRHQALRETIFGSYRLLDDAAQQMLARLSVFRGGFSLEAAEAIAGDGRDAVEMVARLVDKSLVIAEPKDDQMRYRLLDTIRQFAGERLTEVGQDREARERHLGYFLALGEAGAAALKGPGQALWLARLDAEADNFYAALGFALEGGAEDGSQVDRALRLAHALTPAWHMRGRHAIGRGWLQRVIGAGRGKPSVLLAQALLDLGTLMAAQADAAAAAQPVDEGLAVLDEVAPDEKRLRATALLMRGAARWSMLNNEGAREALEESLALFEKCGDEAGRAEARWQLGVTSIGTDGGLALELATERLAAYEKLGDEFAGSQPRFQLAHLRMLRGDYDAAKALYSRCLDDAGRYRNRFAMIASLLALGRLDRLTGDVEGAYERHSDALLLTQESRLLLTNALEGMGFTLLEQGRHQLATAFFQAGLENFQMTGDPMNVSACLIGIAHAKTGLRQPKEAARLLGAVESSYAVTGPGQYWYDRPDLERAMRAVRAKMGERDFDAARAEGGGLGLAEAVKLALEWSEPDAVETLAARTALQAAKARFDGLTAREREIAALVAEGQSNREIGERLVVSERTVDSHVANILAKLGVASRAQIVAWAVRKGLTPADEGGRNSAHQWH